jgi:hypothetical protein
MTKSSTTERNGSNAPTDHVQIFDYRSGTWSVDGVEWTRWNDSNNAAANVPGRGLMMLILNNGKPQMVPVADRIVNVREVVKQRDITPDRRPGDTIDTLYGLTHFPVDGSEQSPDAVSIRVSSLSFRQTQQRSQELMRADLADYISFADRVEKRAVECLQLLSKRPDVAHKIGYANTGTLRTNDGNLVFLNPSGPVLTVDGPQPNNSYTVAWPTLTGVNEVGRYLEPKQFGWDDPPALDDHERAHAGFDALFRLLDIAVTNASHIGYALLGFTLSSVFAPTHRGATLLIQSPKQHGKSTLMALPAAVWTGISPGRNADHVAFLNARGSDSVSIAGFKAMASAMAGIPVLVDDSMTQHSNTRDGHIARSLLETAGSAVTTGVGGAKALRTGRMRADLPIQTSVMTTLETKPTDGEDSTWQRYLVIPFRKEMLRWNYRDWDSKSIGEDCTLDDVQTDQWAQRANDGLAFFIYHALGFMPEYGQRVDELKRKLADEVPGAGVALTNAAKLLASITVLLDAAERFGHIDQGERDDMADEAFSALAHASRVHAEHTGILSKYGEDEELESADSRVFMRAVTELLALGKISIYEDGKEAPPDSAIPPRLWGWYIQNYSESMRHTDFERNYRPGPQRGSHKKKRGAQRHDLVLMTQQQWELLYHDVREHIRRQSFVLQGPDETYDALIRDGYALPITRTNVGNQKNARGIRRFLANRITLDTYVSDDEDQGDDEPQNADEAVEALQQQFEGATVIE